MKLIADCLPCILRQIISTARAAGADDEAQQRAVLEGLKVLQGVNLDRTPGEVSYDCLKRTYEVLGDDDPFRAQKKQQNERALSRVEMFRRLIEKSADPLLSAFKLAAAGNIIDSGIQSGYDFDATLKNVLARPFAVDDYPLLAKKLAGARRVLYVADNAGEAVIDRLVMERLGDADVTCVVRRSPVINDITAEEAREVGLDKVARIIDPGIDSLGVPLKECPASFVAEFERADLIISKGQANFETLDESAKDEKIGGKLFYVLMAKCDCVAKALGVRMGEAVLKRAG